MPVTTYDPREPADRKAISERIEGLRPSPAARAAFAARMARERADRARGKTLAEHMAEIDAALAPKAQARRAA